MSIEFTKWLKLHTYYLIQVLGLEMMKLIQTLVDSIIIAILKDFINTDNIAITVLVMEWP